MSLPIKYKNNVEYFQSSLEFLCKYSWIYRSANTCFIKDRIIDEMPNEWAEYFLNVSLEDLNNFPLRKLSNLPKSLQSFYEQLNDLIPIHDIYDNFKYDLMDKNRFKGIDNKKYHEILNLSNTVIKYCNIKSTDTESHNVNNIFIDIGCGLGYLSQMLHEKYNDIKILCIDANEKLINKAIKRQKEYYPLSIGKINFIQYKITNESGNFIMKKIHELYLNANNSQNDDDHLIRLHIMGLHTCADLFITIINLFYQLNTAYKLICMPCCYHKFEINDHYQKTERSKRNESNKQNEKNEYQMKYSFLFKTFPISKELQLKFKTFQNHMNLNELLNRPFLRLACQQKSSKWSVMNENDHTVHGNEMFIRGVLEYIINNVNDKNDKYQYKLIKNDLNELHKNLIRKYSNNENIINFNEIKNFYKIQLNLSSQNSKVINANCSKNDYICWNDHHEKLFNEINLKYRNGYKLAEGLTCLQTTMQEFCENVVLLDRMCYINNLSDEKQIKTETKLCKIVDDFISPRCFAVLSNKI